MNVVLSKFIVMIIASHLAAIIYSQTSIASESVTISDSDTELKAIKARMKDIRSVLNALPKTVTEPGLGAQVLEAQKTFEIAERNFKAGNWKVAIAEAKRFLDLTQKPDHKTWLKARFMLGRAFEEIGQPTNAAKMYLNYLATLSTSNQQHQQDLTEVFGRLVRLATKKTRAPNAELSQFLSSIVATNRPIEVADQMKYFSGVAGSNIGQTALAWSWLDSADSQASSLDTKARSKYFKALMSIHEQNWQAAAEQLEEVIKIEAISTNIKDMAHLALARVELKQQKPSLAIKNYESINDASDSHREANLEKIFVLIQQNKPDDALKSSQKWLSKYQNHQDALQVTSLISWLELKSGNLDAAKSGIEKTRQLLTTIRTELKNNFQGPGLNKEDAERLTNLTRGHVTPVQDLDDISATFRQLDDLNERISEIDALERRLIFALASSDLRQFKPALANQLTQYDALADETLQAGAKLIYIDRARIADQLTDLDRQKLDANEKRRISLFGKYEQLRRQLYRWATWAPPAEQLTKLAKNWERLDVIAGKSAATGMISEKDPDIPNINERINATRQDMLNTLRSLQAARAENLVDQSELTDSLSIFEAYHELLGEDMTLLAAYSPSRSSTSEKLDDSDSRMARAEWDYTASAIKLGILDLRKRARDDLWAVLTNLSTSERTKLQLLADVDSLRSILEAYAGERLPSIISQFDYAIGQRMGKQLKWTGDLEYLKYADSTNAQDAGRRKHELEKQILSDDIRDYNQRRSK